MSLPICLSFAQALSARVLDPQYTQLDVRLALVQRARVIRVHDLALLPGRYFVYLRAIQPIGTDSHGREVSNSTHQGIGRGTSFYL